MVHGKIYNYFDFSLNMLNIMYYIAMITSVKVFQMQYIKNSNIKFCSLFSEINHCF